MRAPASIIFLGGIALLCLAAGTTLVVVSSKSRHVLVRDDYYRDGLELDSYRAREAAFDSLGLSLDAREEHGALVVEAAKKASGGSYAGQAAVRGRLGRLSLTLKLRRPDDAGADRDMLMTYAASAPHVWVADADPLRRGRWNIRAVFTDSTGNPVMENSFVYDAPDNGATEQWNK